MSFRIGLLALILMTARSLHAGAIAPADSRNTDTPGTDTHFVFKTPDSLETWQARRAALKSQILAAAGLLPMPEKSALNPQVFGKLDRKEYTIEKALLETLPGYFLGGNLYRPSAPGRHPAVLVPHGHWTYGRLENQPLCSTQALSATLARLGFVVFMYDMVGYNDTAQTPHRFGGDAERLWSFGPLGLQLWNSVRVVDFLTSLPDVDPAQIGMAGASGGATQTFMLMATDDRIKFLSPVNMVSAYMQGGDYCENAPGLRIGTNNVEIASMAAPRPMLIVSATGDWTKHVPYEEFPEVQAVYKLYGKPENVSVVQFNAPHNLNEQSRQAVEQFFDRTVFHDSNAEAVNENNIQIEEIQDMLALSNRRLPDNALNFQQVFDLWKRMATQQMNSIGDTEQLRNLLAADIGVHWPDHVISEQNGDQILMQRTGFDDRVPAHFQKGGDTAVLIVDPAGADAALKSGRFRSLSSNGQSVLAIDAFQTGSAVAPRDRSATHFLTFNLCDDANRVQDILTALRYLQDQGFKEIEIAGTGKAAWWTEFAAAIAPASLKLHLKNAGSSVSDGQEAFLANFNVPGILRAGGLQTAERLLKAENRTQ
jgi:dienelactone hydrolase